MKSLKRISTQYRGADDRVLLTGEFPNGSTVSLWLTQRLLLRAIPILIDWLQKQTPTDLRSRTNSEQARQIAQTFSQPAVQVRKIPVQVAGNSEAPAPTEEADNVEALIHSIDINFNDKAVRLRFKGATEEHGMVALNPQQLRQWLAVLQVLWRKAEWPEGIWPKWLKSDAELASTQSKGAFH